MPSSTRPMLLTRSSARVMPKRMISMSLVYEGKVYILRPLLDDQNHISKVKRSKWSQPLVLQGCSAINEVAEHVPELSEANDATESTETRRGKPEIHKIYFHISPSIQSNIQVS